MSDVRQRDFWVTYALIAANVAMFAFELASGVDAIHPTAQSVLPLGGNFGPRTLDGEWWRLGTAMFLHFGVLHIGLNMLCLWQGRIVEKMFGHGAFATLYVVAGLVGGIASLLRGSNGVSAGASGAVFGVYGAFAGFLVVRRSTIDPAVWSKTARSIGVFVLMNLAFGLSVPGIDMSAHIGGIVAGFAGAVVLSIGAHPAEQHKARVLGVLAVGIAVVVAALLLLPKPVDVDALFARLNAADRASVAAYEEARQRKQAKAISGAELADLLEHQIMPPLRAAADAMAPELGKVSGRANELVVDQLAIANDRLVRWTTLVQAERATDPAEAKRLFDASTEQEKTVNADVQAFEAESARLKATLP
jgi:rhomboid protease GluP